MTSLYLVPSGQTSAAADLDQLVQALNGVSAPQINVANRINASLPGTGGQGGMMGGTFTAGDLNQNSPATQPNSAVKASPPTSLFGAVPGDTVVDQAGIFWVLSSLSPYVGVGKGGDNARTRSSILPGTIGGPFGNYTYWGGWDYGAIQFNYQGLTTKRGFVIPTPGYYQVTASFHVKGSDATTNFWFGVELAPVGTVFGPGSSIPSVGDFIKGGASASGDCGGTMIDDVLSLNQGDQINFIVEQSSGTTPTTGSSTGTSDAVIFAIVELLCAAE